MSQEFRAKFRPYIDVAPTLRQSRDMQPAPIRNKPLFYALVLLSFGLLGTAIILLTLA